MPDEKRLRHLQAILAERQLDAAALIPGPGFRYLTGAVHYVMERPIVLFVPRAGRPAIVIPTLEQPLFASRGFDAAHCPWEDATGFDAAFAQAIAMCGLGQARIGVEGQRMRFFESEAIRRAAPGAQLLEAHEIISSIRLRKDAGELAHMRAAIRISEAALEDTLAAVRVGMSEREVQTLLINNMSAHGSQGLAFEPIVLAAENSARPHGKVRGDYALRRGDALLFDFGATAEGYPADITRTFFIGEAPAAAREIYDVVLAANELGRSLARPGLACGALDEAVTQFLVDAGHAGLILHRTGHGLGLDVHEAPWITRGNEMPLAEGMVCTIEPGLYQAGALGVRVEDNIVITADGAESLTTFPRELRVVGQA